MLKDNGFLKLLLLSGGVGALAGGTMAVLLLIIQIGQSWLWQQLPQFLFGATATTLPYYRLLIPIIGGGMVGLAIRLWGDPPALLTDVQQEFQKTGRMDYRASGAMLLQTLLSLCYGASLGPEAALTQVTGSLGTWIGDRLKLPPKAIAVMTLAGLSGMLGSLFRSPFGSALLLLEAPHVHRNKYYQLLLPSIVASTAGYGVFKALIGSTYGGNYHFPAISPDHSLVFLDGILLGGVGAGTGVFSIWLLNSLRQGLHPLGRYPMLRGLLGGLGLGGMAAFSPLILFSGELEINSLLSQGAQLGVPLLLLLGYGKIIATNFCLATGFKGGNLFPTMFSGAAIGLALSQMVPGLSPTVGIAGMMVATTVTLLKAPIAVALLFGSIFPSDLMPMMAIATLVSYILTVNVFIVPQNKLNLQAVQPNDKSL